MAGDRIFNFNGSGVTFNDIHDNNNCTIITGKAQDISEDVERDFTHKGAPSRYLFCVGGDDKIENVENKQQQTDNFLHYLADYKLLDKEISASKNNEILKAVVCFVKQWGQKGLTKPVPAVPPIIRFLKQDCQLKCQVDEQTVINVLRNMMGECDSTILEQVKEYF